MRQKNVIYRGMNMVIQWMCRGGDLLPEVGWRGLQRVRFVDFILRYGFPGTRLGSHTRFRTGAPQNSI